MKQQNFRSFSVQEMLRSPSRPVSSPSLSVVSTIISLSSPGRTSLSALQEEAEESATTPLPQHSPFSFPNITDREMSSTMTPPSDDQGADGQPSSAAREPNKIHDLDVVKKAALPAKDPKSAYVSIRQLTQSELKTYGIVAQQTSTSVHSNVPNGLPNSDHRFQRPSSASVSETDELDYEADGPVPSKHLHKDKDSSLSSDDSYVSLPPTKRRRLDPSVSNGDDGRERDADRDRSRHDTTKGSSKKKDRRRTMKGSKEDDKVKNGGEKERKCPEKSKEKKTPEKEKSKDKAKDKEETLPASQTSAKPFRIPKIPPAPSTNNTNNNDARRGTKNVLRPADHAGAPSSVGLPPLLFNLPPISNPIPPPPPVVPPPVSQPSVLVAVSSPMRFKNRHVKCNHRFSHSPQRSQRTSAHRLGSNRKRPRGRSSYTLISTFSRPRRRTGRQRRRPNR